MGSKNTAQNKGFTLIEILVVIGIIAILAAIVIIAINPARQFAQARNSQRISNLNATLNAVGQYLADNKGVFSSCVAGIPQIATPTYPLTAIPSGAFRIEDSGGVDLSCLTPTYIPQLSSDPSAAGAHWNSTSDYDTGYYIFKDSSQRVTVFAPTLEPAVSTTTAFIYVQR